MSKWLALVAGHDGGIIQVVQQSSAIFSEDDLLLGALNSGGEMKIVSLLEFLARL